MTKRRFYPIIHPMVASSGQKIVFIGLFLSVAATLFAHPHMFIDTRLRAVFEGKRLRGLEITWHFDPFFTASILNDYDEDHDGGFDSQEIEEIRKQAFSNLVNYDYFTFISAANRTYVPTEIRSFSAYMDEQTLVYCFFTPFDIPVPAGGISIAIYDDTFFCDILYCEDSPVLIESALDANWQIVENMDKAITYGGPVTASRDDRTYSGTAYPQQVVITLE